MLHPFTVVMSYKKWVGKDSNKHSHKPDSISKDETPISYLNSFCELELHVC